MRTAILLNGNFRTIDKCSDNILNTFNHLNPEYFVSTYRNQFGYHPYIKNFLQYQDDPVFEDSYILENFKVFNPKLIFIENIDDVNQIYYKELPNLHPRMNSFESSYLQYLKIKKGLNIIEQYENLNNIKYDLIIKTRCDLMCKDIKSLDLSNLNKKLIVSTGNVYPNDCVLISERDNMFNIIDFIMNEFYRLTDTHSTNDPPHGILLSASKHNNLSIEQYPIMDYVVRANMYQYY